MLKLNLRFALAIFLLTLAAPLAAHADPVTLVLTQPVQQFTRGATLTFAGTITNNGAPAVNLDRIQIIVANATPSDFTINDAPFFANFPFTLQAFQSASGTLFTITASQSVGTRPFSVTVSIFELVAATNQFRLLAVANALIAQPIPEPATIALLATGLLGIAAKRRRRSE